MGRRGGRRKRKLREQDEEAIRRLAERVETSLFHQVNGESDDQDDPPIPTTNSSPHEAWKKLQTHWPRRSRKSREVSLLQDPSLVQQHVWPVMMCQEEGPAWWNLICLAPTGSGKTLAYGLPLLLLKREPQSKKKNALVLVPTRELVQQVARELQHAHKALQCGEAKKGEGDSSSSRRDDSTTILALHGGTSRQEHLNLLRDNLQATTTDGQLCIVVATTGRLIDLLGQQQAKENVQVSLDSVDTVVLDEADQLAFNKDLVSQVDEIVNTHLRPPFRLCLFSATWPDRVTDKWRAWMQRANSGDAEEDNKPCAVIKINTIESEASKAGSTEPGSTSPQGVAKEKKEKAEGDDDCGEDEAEVKEPVAKKGRTRQKHAWSEIPKNITQTLHVCADHKKPRKLLSTLQQMHHGPQPKNQKTAPRQLPSGIVFFAQIKTLQYTARLLDKELFACVQLHSHMSQDSRERSWQSFVCGKAPLLLATDIAARGLDVAGIRFVVNYDFPSNLQAYVHRCGRAGRDGQPATVFSYFTRNLAPLAPDMAELLQASGQVVDPNLSSLVTGQKEQKKNKKKREKKKAKAAAKAKKARAQDGIADDDDMQDDEFPSLALNRIVLKRASHVSDASSDSSEGEEADHENEATTNG